MIIKHIYVADDETEFSSKQDCLDYEKFCKRFIDISPKLMSYSYKEFWKDGKLVYKLDNVISPSEVSEVWRKFLQLTLEFVDRFLLPSMRFVKQIVSSITEPTWENFGKYPINVFRDSDDEKYSDWPCIQAAYYIISSLDPETGNLYYNRHFYDKIN